MKYPVVKSAALVFALSGLDPLAACELIKTDFGYQVSGPCELRPKLMIKSPNLIVNWVAVYTESGTGLGVDARVVNVGDVGTEGLLVIRSMNNRPRGEFDLEVRMRLIGPGNLPYDIYQNSRGWVSEGVQRRRMGRLAAGASAAANFGIPPAAEFSLPDRNQTYKVIMTAQADPVMTGSGASINMRGEVAESNEQDNFFLGVSGPRYECLAYGQDADPVEVYLEPAFHLNNDINQPLFPACR